MSERVAVRFCLAVAVGVAVLLSAGCATRRANPAVRLSPAAPPPGDPGTTGEYRSDGPEATDTNVLVNQDISGESQNETALAIDPTDPLVMVGAANDRRLGFYSTGYYRTDDGGATWSDGVTPHRKYLGQYDPSVSFCSDGTVLLAYLDTLGEFYPHRIAVCRSTDAGLTWQAPGVPYEGSVPLADKPHVGCDRFGGLFADRAYITWTRVPQVEGNTILAAYSDDYGVTWQGEAEISDTGFNQGSMIAVGRDGEVWAAWQGSAGAMAARSTDGGQNWGAPVTVASIDEIEFGEYYRRWSFPTLVIDTSGGAHDGNVYVVWADDRHGDADILFSRSIDHGASWSDPIRINDDAAGNGCDQYFPWIDVDGNGNVHAMWLDHRGDPGNRYFHVYIATSRDGGVSFDRNLPVSDQPSDGSLSSFLGDYAALAVGPDRIVPFWPDLRDGEANLYMEAEPVWDYDLVTGVRFTGGKETVEFDVQDPALGTGVVYDVIAGDLAGFRAGEPWSGSWCVADDSVTPTASITEIPAAGEAFYLLVRAEGPRGTGSYGSSTAHPDERDGIDDLSACD